MNTKIIQRYLSIKILPIWCILIMDMSIVIASIFLSYIVRYDPIITFHSFTKVWHTLFLLLPMNLIFFRLFRTYSNVLRFSSFIDIMRIFISLSIAYALTMIISILSNSIFNYNIIPISILFIAFVLNFALMSCLRIVVKLLFELLNFDYRHTTNVLVYGAQDAGVNIAKSLRVNLRNHYKLKGFLADESDLINKTIMGVKVYSIDDSLMNVIQKKDIQVIIISPPKMEELKKSNIIDHFLSNNIKLLSAPPLSEWNGHTLQRCQLREVQIEDLLQRETIQVDLYKIASHLEDKRVLITGAAGSIGSEIMRQVASFNPYKLILIDQAETPLHDIRLELQDKWRDIDAETIVADISNQSRMEMIFREFQPEYIFHAAAYKHVPMMEDNVSESIQINVAGTQILADLAVKYKADKFVMISTDKAVNPTNVMGCSKRICEIYVQSLARKMQSDGNVRTQFITTRFGNVLGSNGSVIPRFRDQIRHGGPITVTHPEIIRYFMTIPEACRLVLEAGSMGNGGEIYIFDMGKPVKIIDLAKRMISLSGHNDVKIEFTGLRHGEKLYEELLNVKEFTKPTHHEKIMIATVREYDYDEIKEHIRNLIALSYTYNQMSIVTAMKNIVPEFISRNSCFEKLDTNQSLG